MAYVVMLLFLFDPVDMILYGIWNRGKEIHCLTSRMALCDREDQFQKLRTPIKGSLPPFIIIFNLILHRRAAADIVDWHKEKIIEMSPEC